MKSTPTKETPLQREFREQTEAQARLRAQRDADPQAQAMDAAMRLTKVEQADLQKAEAAVSEAEAAVGRIIGQIQALRNGRTVERTFVRPDGRSLVRRLLDPAKASEAAKEIPELEQDLVGARSALQTAHRKRNRVLTAINQARMRRRAEAKARFAAPRQPVKSRGDWWSSTDRLDGWDKEAA